jgi:ribonuclease R
MTRKKKNSKRGKIKSLPVDILERKLIDLFSKQITTAFDAKTVINKLKISNSKDSVQDCLDRLVKKGKVEVNRRGKYKWNKSASRPKKSKLAANGKTATGRMDVTRSGAAYIICDDPDLDKDIFVPPHKCMGGLDGDTVEVIWQLSRRGKPEGEVISVIKRKTESFIGTLVLSREFAFVVPDNDNMQTDIILDSKKLPKDAEDGAKVVVTISKWHTDNKSNPQGEITTYFGTEGGNDIEMKSILIQKGFNLTFPAEVLEENAAIDTEIKPEEIALRRDMRAITTFTIDPETAKDFDDALSIEHLDNGNYEIGIHIADVTHYVTPGSELDKEAAKRTTSVYLVDRVLPMLPEKLSNGVCSLRPHEEKLTFSAVFEMNMQGEILTEWFGKTAIYSDRRFSYEEAQEVLETGEGDFAKELQMLNNFAHKLRKERFRKGALNFESPEVRFKLDEKGVPLEVYLKSRQDAHMLVEDFMLLANKRVGALIDGLHEKIGIRWPMIYRIHDDPNMEKVQSFSTFAAIMGYPLKINTPEQVKGAYGAMLKEAEGKTEYPILQQLAIRTMAKAAYSSDNIGHYGLGFLTYSHFTSPIRRYADVLAHRILFDYLSDNNKRMNPSKLEDLCKHISKKERDAVEAERESRKYKQAEFLESHIQEIFEGSISGIADHGIYVTIKSNYCEGMIRYDKMYERFDSDEHNYHIKSGDTTYKMGDTVWIRVLGANKYKKQIDMELLDPTNVEELMELQNDKIQEKLEQTKQMEKSESVEKSESATKLEKTEQPEKPQLPIRNDIKPKLKEFKNKVKVAQEPKHKSATSSKPKNKKENNKAYEALLPDILSAFQESDVKTLADKKRAKWKYELCASSPIEGSVLLLFLNPMATKNKGYRQQKLLSQHPFQPEGNLKSFFDDYLPGQQLTKGYVSPFRSIDEKQLSDNDIELSIPIFKAFMSLLKPNQIVTFSKIMLENLSSYDMLTDLVEEEVTFEERTIIVSRAILNVDGQKTPIVFLPQPSERIARELKVLAWDWALKPAE